MEWFREKADPESYEPDHTTASLVSRDWWRLTCRIGI